MSVSETVRAQSCNCSRGRENFTCAQAPWAFALRQAGLPPGEAVHRTGFVFESGSYPELWLVCDTSNSSLFTSARRHLYRTQMPPRRSPFSSDSERIQPAGRRERVGRGGSCPSPLCWWEKGAGPAEQTWL